MPLGWLLQIFVPRPFGQFVSHGIFAVPHLKFKVRAVHFHLESLCIHSSHQHDERMPNGGSTGAGCRTSVERQVPFEMSPLERTQIQRISVLMKCTNLQAVGRRVASEHVETRVATVCLYSHHRMNARRARHRSQHFPLRATWPRESEYLLVAAVYRLTTGHINITTCKSGSQAAERHGKWSARFAPRAVEVPFRIAVLIQTAVLQLHALRHSYKVCAANKKCTFRHSYRCAIGHRFGMIRGFSRNVSASERSTAPVILVAVHKAAIHAGSRIRHGNGGCKHNLIGRTQRNVYRRKERDAKDAFHIRIRRLVSNHVCRKTEQRYT